LWTYNTTHEEVDILYQMEVRHTEVPENAPCTLPVIKVFFWLPYFQRGRIVPRVWAGRFWVQFPAGTRNVSFLQNIQTGCGSHPACWVDEVGGVEVAGS
jgi:hypothetical protein